MLTGCRSTVPTNQCSQGLRGVTTVCLVYTAERERAAGHGCQGLRVLAARDAEVQLSRSTIGNIDFSCLGREIFNVCLRIWLR